MFPLLAQLFDRARAYEVTVDGVQHPLLVWDRADHDDLYGWLLEPPGPIGSPCGSHRILLEDFHGNTYRFGEPDTWLLNTHGTLLAQDTSRDVGFVRGSIRWELAGMAIPIDPDAYYPVSWDNGLTTIVHRTTEEVLMFAQDHSYRHLIALEGCPEYTLYRLEGALCFRDCVEKIAEQWLAPTKP